MRDGGDGGKGVGDGLSLGARGIGMGDLFLNTLSISLRSATWTPSYREARRGIGRKHRRSVIGAQQGVQNKYFSCRRRRCDRFVLALQRTSEQAPHCVVLLLSQWAVEYASSELPFPLLMLMVIDICCTQSARPDPSAVEQATTEH